MVRLIFCRNVYSFYTKRGDVFSKWSKHIFQTSSFDFIHVIGPNIKLLYIDLFLKIQTMYLKGVIKCFSSYLVKHSPCRRIFQMKVMDPCKKYRLFVSLVFASCCVNTVKLFLCPSTQQITCILCNKAVVTYNNTKTKN
jgi:hypothetical protein